MKLAVARHHLFLSPVDELGVSGSAAPGGGRRDVGSPSFSSSNLPGQPKKKQKTPAAGQESAVAASDVKWFVYMKEGEEVDAPPRGTHVRFAPNITEVPEGFSEGSSLTMVVLNEGLLRIKKDAFAMCTSLESITFPSTLREIGDSAFAECDSLTEVVLNEGLERIEQYVFSDCTSLESITFPSSLVDIPMSALNMCSSLTKVVLNEGLERIMSFAFLECTSLESITFPSTLREIGGSVFSQCSRLTEVVFNEGLTVIGHDAFKHCRSLESITFPSSLVELGFRAFAKCSSLTEAVFNEGLVRIKNDAFKGCTSLESMTFPSTLCEIGEGAVTGAARDIFLSPSQFQTINPSGFARCSSLEKFKFPCLSRRLRSTSSTSRREVETKIGNTDFVQLIEGEISISGPTDFQLVDPQWGLIIPETPLEFADWFTARRGSLREVCESIKRSELRDATAIVDLAFWKARIGVAEAAGEDTTVRMAHRVEVPGPVRENIVSYLFYRGNTSE